jgi:Right handed beta helix region
MPIRWLVICLLTTSTAHAQTAFDCVPPATPLLVNPVVLGTGAAGSVTTAALQTALTAGGDIRLNVGASTIALTQELVISKATTLDANGATLSGGNTHRVLRVSNPNNLTYTFNLLNATVANGNSRAAGSAVSDKSGAGLWKPSVNEAWQVVTIRVFHSHFTNNTAVQSAQDDGGGGLYAVGAKEVSVVDSTFDSNNGSNGGALYSLVSQNVNLYDSTFSNNKATGTGGNPGNGGNGGAIGIDGGVDDDPRFLNLCRVIVRGNTGNAFGAGLFTTTYSGNSFTRVLDSTFDNNTASQLTGGAYIQGSPVSIYGSTFSNNHAPGYTGLLLFGYGGVLEGDITNTTFAGNIASTGLGGGLAIQDTGALLIQNVTFAGNQATGAGSFSAAIDNDQASSANLTLRNVLFWNNTAGNAYNPWAMRYPAAHGSNNMQWPQSRGNGQTDAAAAPDTEFVDALLLPLADNGGLTETVALPAESPAADAGTAMGAPTTDQRGKGRYKAVDIGAFEYFVDEIFAGRFGD